MEKKITKFLKYSFVSIVMICIVVFVFLTVFMSRKTNQTILDVSDIYMSEMNTQVQQKFSSIISLRLEQVDAVVRGNSPSIENYSDAMLKNLQKSAEVRNFLFLGFLAGDGEIETVYGKTVTIDDNDYMMYALKNHDNIVGEGHSSDGEKVLILGKRASYRMADGKVSVALIVGIPMEYLNQALFLYEKDATMYYHIIDSDGKFVIRNGDAYRDNYFDRIREAFETLNGKDADQYIKGLREAIDTGSDYSTDILVDGEKRHIYCSQLSENSNWYLISVMPYGELNTTLIELDSTRIILIIGSMTVLLLVMSVIFLFYFKLTRRQVKELNEARQEAVCANKAKSEFLSSMSHDIRTPMNAIIGMTEIALKNQQDSIRVEDCLKKVKLSSKHLLGLINDVLDMSKIESGKMTLNFSPMSLKESMDDIVNIMQPQVKARNQYFDIFIQKILTENVNCDSVRLNQVLLNLLSNAVKFTPEKGRINIYLYQEESPLGDAYVQTHIKIKDTGIGMSQDFQRKIFDTFTREETEQVRQISGTGLGMAITKGIVDMMGGTITLQSEQGKGSEFHIVLDLEKAAEKEEEMKLPSWNILVVDDNEQLCSSAAANIEELGAHADWTLDGSQAVQMIEERHKKQEDYHFVLIDWKMPNMDGLQTIREIRNRVDKEIPVFLISAYDWSEIEDQVFASEIEGFISKPLFKSTIFSRLKQYIGESDQESEQKENEEIKFNGKHILLAEDIDINWEIANEIFSAVGLELERAVNGKECLEKFENSEIGSYDAIFMDIRMPVMNGYEAATAIRALERADHDLPIIAMTADAFSDDAQHCLECGMDVHIAKPLDIKECMRVLQKYLK